MPVEIIALNNMLFIEPSKPQDLTKGKEKAHFEEGEIAMVEKSCFCQN